MVGANQRADRASASAGRSVAPSLRAAAGIAAERFAQCNGHRSGAHRAGSSDAAERSDISEELDRLRSHLLQFGKLLDGAGELGKN